MIIQLIDDTVARGARQFKACEILGVAPTTVQRWRNGREEDQRHGPKSNPPNKFTELERRQILKVMNSPTYRDLPPSQIVPRLADEGIYYSSESSMYRILRAMDQAGERGRAKPRAPRRCEAHVATGPNQVWSWDITYLKAPIRGTFFYLYMIIDVWSRKVVGWEVQAEECAELASTLLMRACRAEGVAVTDLLVLHADNGGPMKGATMLATMEKLGVLASFSRPRVSDDNPYSESCFRTLKYRPDYPDKPFASLEKAREWVLRFVDWYNREHRHSGIRFVTPAQRHDGEEIDLLARREEVYEAARLRHPNRWSRKCRDWSPVETVELNPGRERKQKKEAA